MFHNLSHNLRRIRRSRDLTQVDLAATTRLSQQYLSSLERGLRPTRDDHVHRLAEALGVSDAALLRSSGAEASRRGRGHQGGRA